MGKEGSTVGELPVDRDAVHAGAVWQRFFVGGLLADGEKAAVQSSWTSQAMDIMERSTGRLPGCPGYNGLYALQVNGTTDYALADDSDGLDYNWANPGRLD